MDKIKLCVFDLDGTLLNSNKEISEKTISSIKNLSKIGIKYTIATGRIDILARKYHRLISSDLPIISCNGSIIRDLSNKVYHMEVFDFNTVKNIFNYLVSKNLDFLFYTEDEILITKNNPRIEFLETYNKTAIPCDRFKFKIFDNDIEKYSNHKFLKALAYIKDRDVLLKTQKNLIELFKNLPIVSSDYNLLDIMPPNVNKKNALSILCDILNIKSSEVCVFGDNFNDIEMFEFAGTSIAPENGEDDIKKMATYITKHNNEDGIAYAIDEIILKNT